MKGNLEGVLLAADGSRWVYDGGFVIAFGRLLGGLT